jgi:hypothetical protein
VMSSRGSLGSSSPLPPNNPTRSVTVSPNNGVVVSPGAQDKLFDGLMKIVSDTLESLAFVLCPVGSVQLAPS